MTPAKTSSSHNKAVTPSTAKRESTEKTDKKSQDDEIALIPKSNPKGDLLYHIPDDSQNPVCQNTGEYDIMLLSEAKEVTDRPCGKCLSISNGGSNKKSCPKCRRKISLPQWPQHVRKCDGNPEETG